MANTIALAGPIHDEIIRLSAIPNNYPEIYRYIANNIANGSIVMAGGINSKYWFWFNGAMNINANTTDPVTIFIREAAKYGMQEGGIKQGTAQDIQEVSNTIGAGLIDLIKNYYDLPSMETLLNNDIAKSAEKSGITLGGWGGSIYYWDTAYIDPLTHLSTTVGGYIESHPAEHKKFIRVFSSATVETINKFGVLKLATDPAALNAAMDGVLNFGLRNKLAALELTLNIDIKLAAQGNLPLWVIDSMHKIILDFQKGIIIDNKVIFSDGNVKPVWANDGYTLMALQTDANGHSVGSIVTGIDAGKSIDIAYHQLDPDVGQFAFTSFQNTNALVTSDFYTIKIDDGHGGVTVTERTPNVVVNGLGKELVGTTTTVTKKQGAVVLSVSQTSETVNHLTGEHTLETVDVQNDLNGNLLQRKTTTELLSASNELLRKLDVTKNVADGSILSMLTERQLDYSLLTTIRDTSNTIKSTISVQKLSDGSLLTIENNYVDGKPILKSSTLSEFAFDSDGKSVQRDTVTTPDGTVRYTYVGEGDSKQLFRTEPIPFPSIANLSTGQIATAFNDLTSVIYAIKSGQPLPIFASGLHLINDLNVNHPLPGLNSAANYVDGAMSFYNLYNAMQSGSDFAKLNATLSTVSFVNAAIFSSTATSALGVTTTTWSSATAGSLNSVLNGNGAGIFNGGSVGVLPALGLITAIQNNDPIGMAMSIGTLINPAFMTTPAGWVLIGASLLKALFSDNSPPKAWGSANVTFGPGITNYGLQVNATGENFGTGRVQGQLQNMVTALQSIVDQNNAATADASQRLGVIAQRLPSLNFKAAEFADKGYAITDIDPLTGAQRFANVRFDDNGQIFGIDPNSITPELRAMLTLAGAPNYPALNAYMLNSALQRQALAPMWEVQTAKMQTLAGDPNAGLTEEVRAAKAGYGAAVDAAYAAAHPDDTNASAKHVGHFMPIGIDLDHNGSVSTLSIAQTEATNHPVSFDWDGTGYQKQTGWIAKNDGFLVLDRNFNGSVDNGTELLSNPLIADLAKGLRSLVALDANADGRIDAFDPVYSQLKVWQDLDQDGNNTHYTQIGNTTMLAQDESNGVAELRGLASWGISAIDYANGRYEYKSVPTNPAVSYGLISTQTLEADDEGVTYTPVLGGIRISATNGKPEVVATQVQSDATVYDLLALKTAGESITLNEDASSGVYNPAVAGVTPIAVTIGVADLLKNDSWHSLVGAAAGLVVTGVSNGAHVNGFKLDAQGNISLMLEANYNGLAGFDYTVKSTDGQLKTARVSLNVVPVNDAPVVNVTLDQRSATELGNDGYVVPTDPDGITAFTFEVVSNPLYGRLTLNATTGRFDYVGERYVAAQNANVYTDEATAAEQRFTDYFTVRVKDGVGGVTDKQIGVTHFGPAAQPIVQPSGGKKPIAIDLDGNGLQFTDVNDSNVFMDVNGDGWKRRIAWVKPGDGLLAFDKDSNGKIESFDEFAFLGYAPIQQTDLAAVKAAFDSNGNGLLDAGDAKWKQFGVWQDANSNGVQEAGEFKSLTDLGINSVGLTSDGHFQVINGQTVHGMAVATKSNGTTLAVADVTLRTSNEAQVPTGPATNTTVVKSAFGTGQAFVGTTGKDLVLGTVASDSFNTGDGDDVITDDGGNDVVESGTGNDLIATGVDDDIVNAGAGNDTVFAGAGNDVVFGDGVDAAGAGENGDDTIMLEDGNDVAFGGNGNDFISGGAGNDVISGNAGRDQLFGEGGWDALFGQEDDDELYGMDGNDLLEGGAGNDLLSGGTGDDSMSGGAGDDIYEVDSAGDTVNELLNGVDTGGIDTVRASISYSLSNELENLTLIGSADLSGAGNVKDNTMVGNAGRNVLRSLAGNDVLDGGLGADTMAGGEGNDTYMVDDVGDVVTESAAQGVDTVQSRVSYALSDNIENLTLVGVNAINGTGNSLGNVMIGNVGANRLRGGAGNDTLRGGSGNDAYVFALGDGQDSIEENDASFGNVDIIAFATGINASAVTGHRAGLDFVLNYSETDSITIKNWYVSNAQKVEQINFADGTVWNAAQIATMANHAPTVANVPATQMLTEMQAFTYVAPTNMFSDIDMGDTLTYSATVADTAGLPAWLTFDALTRTLSGTPPNDGAGLLSIALKATDEAGAFVNAYLQLDIANIMNGTPNADQLTGTQWRDIINGMAGGDTLVGGAGDDTFLVNGTDMGWDSYDRFEGDAGYDVILGGAGDDMIRMTTYSGVNTVEKIDGGAGVNIIKGDGTYGSTLDLSTTQLVNIARIEGGAAGDWLTGSTGNDIIYGMAGGDTLVGGAGDDTFLVNGTDAGFDSFRGDAGNDVILGGAGDDTIRMKTYSGVNTVEKIDGGAGVNIIKGDGTYGSTLDLSTTQLVNIARIEGGAAGDTLIGSGGKDVVFGDLGNDVLRGNAGDDWMAGGKGNDVLDAGSGSNLFAFNRGDGVDTVNNSTSGLDIVSLGAGITYANLKLAKVGNNLVLDMGSGESMSFTNWYSSVSNHGVNRLQVVTVGGDYNAASTDKTRNKIVEQFDFTKLVQSFDIAVAANSTMASGWNVMNGLLNSHLLASDTQALGGDLSVKYATGGSLLGLGLVATPTTLQTFKPSLLPA